MKRKTKIICTIGPACEKKSVLEQLIIAGMDIARFNFSHATYEGFAKSYKLIKNLEKKHKKKIEILVDLQGPRIRVGELPKEGRELREGTTVTFTTDRSNTKAIYIDDPHIPQNIQKNHPIYLANGEIELAVVDKKDNEIIAKVIRGGILYSRKAVNVPETVLTTTGLTEKDLKDITFVLPFGIDYIGQSFIKNAHDIFKLRQLLGGAKTKIVAKIETKQAVLNIDWIIQVTDLLMIARGDLGIELPLEDLPLIQKDTINRANLEQKPVIVATQMLSSMVNHHRPTRAEISDVANAVLDGAWGVMLSEETAFGKYPKEAVSYLEKTVARIEEFQANFT